ncbi:hypothetical protein HD806DRAFT_514645 [Xylariaceae sp. AK1471]|nr:hypothetical protein HD806DRAFT_514645 [Xylariaceae sp. AK1471]
MPTYKGDSPPLSFSILVCWIHYQWTIAMLASHHLWAYEVDPILRDVTHLLHTTDAYYHDDTVPNYM